MNALVASGLVGDSGDPGFGDPGLGDAGFGNPDAGFFFGFGAFGVLFVVMFAVVAGVIIYRLVQGGAQWQRNNDSPVLTVPATVVTKRQDTHGGMNDTSARTSYFATFQLESGERIELPVSGSQYGLLAEGDQGQLTHRGTRYQGFDRGAAPNRPQSGAEPVGPAVLPPPLPQDSPQD